MRYDILNIAVVAHLVEDRLKVALGAVDEPDRFGSKSHLKVTNGGWLRVSTAFTDEAKAVVSLHSDLDDADHNVWAIEVFNAACRVTDSDVDLFDEEDRVVKSRRI